MGEICAKKLTLAFGQRSVFEGLDFCWQERRIGVIGRNGSGKSTLARLIAGLIAPDQGEILVDGFDLFEAREEALRLVGIVFQNPDHQIIFPSVIEELKFGFAQKGVKDAEARAMEVLEKYGKADWKDRMVHHLSQGQRHFVALISILEMRPEVLILDEPFTGLDIPTVMRLQSLLEAFEGMVVHITHEPDLIADYDRVVWIEGGSIAGDGAPGAVLGEFLARMRKMGGDDAVAGF